MTVTDCRPIPESWTLRAAHPVAKRSSTVPPPIKGAFSLFVILLFPIAATSADLSYSTVAFFDGAAIDAARYAAISPDGRKIAVPIRVGKEEYVSINDEVQPRYDKILAGSLVWSSDSTTLIYAGERDGVQYLVRHGAELPATGRVLAPGFASNPNLSDDGKAALWLVASDGGTALLKDGKLVDKRDRIAYVRFRKDHHYVYVAQSDCRYQVVDSEHGAHPLFYSVGLPRLSKMPGSYIYQARTATEYQLLRHDNTLIARSPEEFLHFSLSPDGSRIFYTEQVRSAAAPERTTVHVTGLPPVNLDGTMSPWGNAVFSPDSSRVLYVGVHENQYQVVVDDKKLGTWHFVAVESLTWSTDGRHYAFVAGDNDAKGVYVITDSAKYGPYPNVLPFSLRYSADGKSFAFVANMALPGKRPAYTVVANGKKNRLRFDEVPALEVHLNGRPVYLAKTENRPVLVFESRQYLLDADAAYEKHLRIREDGGVEVLVRKGREYRVATIAAHAVNASGEK